MVTGKKDIVTFDPSRSQRHPVRLRIPRHLWLFSINCWTFNGSARNHDDSDASSIRVCTRCSAKLLQLLRIKHAPLDIVSNGVCLMLFAHFPGIHGLLPPRIKSLEEQCDHSLRNRKSR